MNEYSNHVSKLSPNERCALLYILKNDHTHGYELMDKTSLTRMTAYGALKALEKTGLLTVEIRGKRPGQPMKEYYPNLTGLSVALTHMNEPWNKIDEIDEKIFERKSIKNLLPVVFTKWVFFKEKGLAEKVKKGLAWALENHAENWRYGQRWEDGGEWSVVEKFIEYMEKFSSLDAAVKWHKALHEDEELGKRVEGFNKRQLCIHEKMTEQRENRVKIDEERKKPNPDWEIIKKLELKTPRPAI